MSKKKRIFKLPKEWPILSSSHMNKGSLAGGVDNFCLIGHALETCIGEGTSTEFAEWWATSERSALIRIRRVCSSGSRVAKSLFNEMRRVAKEDDEKIDVINDTGRRPLKELARIWNRTGANFGYVIGNPEKPMRKAAAK